MSETVKMPMLGATMQEGTFVNWLKEVGEPVKQGDVIAEIEADKATIEIESPYEGVLGEKFVSAGDVVVVGKELARIDAAGEVKAPPPPPKPAPSQVEQVSQAVSVAVTTAMSQSIDPDLPEGVKASPLARRLAEEMGIDLRQVQGTGPGGRIVKSDIENFKAPVGAPAAATSEAGASAMVRAMPSAPMPVNRPIPTGEGITTEPVSRMRARIAARTVESKQTIPHFYLTVEIDMAPALELRKQINASLPEEQKVSVNDMVVKAVALSLRKFPNLNSHFYGDTIVRYRHINIGIAVALEGGGLVNVVAKNADSTSISRLAQHNKEMFARVRSGKITPDDIEGATFTVSNLGPYDVEHFEAIISPPEAAILAVASARQVPVVVDGQLAIGNRMKVSLSVDHRVSDGAEGALFLKEFRELMENPMRLLV